MKYFGVKKLEGECVRNDSNVVVKQKTKRKSMIGRIVIIQFCACLLLVGIFSVVKMLNADDSISVFSQNANSFKLFCDEKKVEIADGVITINADNNMVRSVLGGEVIEIEDGIVKIQHDGEFVSEYLNIENVLLKKGTKVRKNEIFSLKNASKPLVIKLYCRGELVTDLSKSGGEIVWQTK